MKTSIKEIVDAKQLPVFIGVTGHRNLRSGQKDQEQLEAAVRKVLSDMIDPDETTGKSKKYPHTEFMLLTSLAAGADQFVTEVVKKMGLRYGVVLPMKRETFLNRSGKDGIPDFTDAQKETALRLMNDRQCLFVHELPEEGDDDQKFRDAARFISDNSCCTIALWDGLIDKNQTAGTGATVRDSLHGVNYRSEYFSGITVPETRPVYHIYTPRDNTPHESENFYKVRSIFPQPLLETGDSWFTLNECDKCDETEIARRFSPDWEKKNRQKRQKLFTGYLRSIDRYNQSVVRHDSYIEKKKYDIVPEDKLLRKTDATYICNQYYLAFDPLAQYYQNRRNHLGRSVIVLAGVAYISLNFFSDFSDKSAIPLWLYVGLLLLALLVLGWIRFRIDYHNAYVYYRAIAEGLRVQFFWDAANIYGGSRTKAQVQDYYLRRQKNHIEWVRMALRTINLLGTACSINDSSRPSLEQVRNVSDLWLGKMDVYNEDTKEWEFPLSAESGIMHIKNNGQCGYYLNKSIRSRSDVTLPAALTRKEKRNAVSVSKFYRMGRLFRILEALCMMVSVVLIIGLTAVMSLSPDNAILSKDVVAGVNLKKCLVFVAGLLPIVAMVLREWTSFMGYREDVNRCIWYYSIFKRAINEIEGCATNSTAYPTEEKRVEAIQRKLFEIGKEALIENADWVMLNEKRAPEIPTN